MSFSYFGACLGVAAAIIVHYTVDDADFELVFTFVSSRRFGLSSMFRSPAYLRSSVPTMNGVVYMLCDTNNPAAYIVEF